MVGKILYIGMKNDYGDESRALSYDYNHIYQSLVDGKIDCTFFDYMVYLKTNSHESLQRTLVELATSIKPDLVIFSLYTDQINVETVQSISKNFKTFGLFFDDTWRREFVVKYGGVMHFFTTTDPFGETIYNKLPITGKAIYFSYGINPMHFYPNRTQLNRDISFVGSWSSTREWVYKELSKSGFKIDFYGHGWGNGLLDNKQMVECFQQSKINLNLSNSVQDNLSYIFSSPRAFKNYFMGAKKGEQLKGRHSEINGCGGFQISFYTDGLAGIYELGKEIEVYQSIEDLKFKLDFYLEHESQREAIASAGLKRSQDYLYLDVMNRLFQKMGLV